MPILTTGKSLGWIVGDASFPPDPEYSYFPVDLLFSSIETD